MSKSRNSKRTQTGSGGKAHRFTNFWDNIDSHLDSYVEHEACSLLRELGYAVLPYSRRSSIDPANTIYSQVPFNRMKLDFALIDAQIAIEIQGDYWHGNTATSLSVTQARNKTRDQKKMTALQNAGWKLIKVWEIDVIERPQRAAHHIKTSILNLIDV